VNNVEVKRIQPEERADSSREIPDKNKGESVAESLAAANRPPTECTGTDPFDNPIFVNVPHQYIGKGIGIIGAPPRK
jgi:hypothetical protein